MPKTQTATTSDDHAGSARLLDLRVRSLRPLESDLIDGYRALPPSLQQHVRQIVQALAARTKGRA
jgi:hypothetical protein